MGAGHLGKHTQCIRCEGLACTDRALNGKVVEEDLVGHALGRCLTQDGSDLQRGRGTYSLQVRDVTLRASVLVDHAERSRTAAE